MLDAYPVMQQFVSWIADNHRAYRDILSAGYDLHLSNKESGQILVRIANSVDPVHMQMYDDMMKAARIYMIDPVWLRSYSDSLRDVLIAGWKVKYMLAHMDSIMTDQEKLILEALHDNVVKCREDIARYYNIKIQAYNTLCKIDYSDLSSEVENLLKKNPFNKKL
jgi:hypothetical protein